MKYASRQRFYAYLVVALATGAIAMSNLPQMPIRLGADNSAAPRQRVEIRQAQQYRGTLTVSHPNAWQAQRQLETRLALIRSLIDVQGGTLRLDEVRYRRERKSANSTADGTRFEIDQNIMITLPRAVNWVQFKEDIARLSP